MYKPGYSSLSAFTTRDCSQGHWCFFDMGGLFSLLKMKYKARVKKLDELSRWLKRGSVLFHFP
jgi:hypothetical protein